MPEQNIVGGDAHHERAVSDTASHGIEDLRQSLNRYPQQFSVEDLARVFMGPIMDDSSDRRSLYPQNPEQFTPVEIPTGAIEALKKFKAKKTFRMTIEERFEEMKTLIADLSAVHNLTCPTMSMEGCTEENRNAAGVSGGSSYNPASHHITMRGKLSIITLLHEFGHALGDVRDEYFACGYSTELFKAVYPDQFARLNYSGHMATR